MKSLITNIFKIITIIERVSDMNETTAKTVSSPTSYKTKLVVDLAFGGHCT